MARMARPARLMKHVGTQNGPRTEIWHVWDLVSQRFARVRFGSGYHPSTEGEWWVFCPAHTNALFCLFCFVFF